MEGLWENNGRAVDGREVAGLDVGRVLVLRSLEIQRPAPAKPSMGLLAAETWRPEKRRQSSQTSEFRGANSPPGDSRCTSLAISSIPSFPSICVGVLFAFLLPRFLPITATAG